MTRKYYVEVEKFQNQQKEYAKANYYDEVLLPLIKRGDWTGLEDVPVALVCEGKADIKFGEDRWCFSKHFKSMGLDKDFDFNLLDDAAEIPVYINGARMVGAEQTLRNQLKCFIVALLYFVPKTLAVNTIFNYLSQNKRLARFMLMNGIDSFDGFSPQIMKEFISIGFRTNESGIAAINSLNSAHAFLPFSMDMDIFITASSVGAKLKPAQQYMVAPPRIYMGLLEEFSNIVDELYKHRDEIELAMRDALDTCANGREFMIESIRNGRSNPQHYINPFNKAVNAFEEAGIPLIDHMKNDDWMSVWNEVGATITIPDWSRKKITATIGKRKFVSASHLKDYLFVVDNQCKYLCLALSGMRTDELYRMSPIHGAQTVEIDRQKIYLFTTRQSKITLNSQTRDDVYVTTEIGYKAYCILNAIHTPIRERFTEEKGRMFGSVANIASRCYAVSKRALAGSIQKIANNTGTVSMVLEKDDMKYLQISDPSQNKYNEGDVFTVLNHSLRRSLAFYLIGYELLSFPQLKQQFSHYSIAMTRWYARNASSFQKMHSEVNRERTIQQSEVFTRIYRKMANNERIAGGKGKAAIHEISMQGPSYFEEKDNKRKLSTAYWEKQIKGKTAHLHAIAPGMYCTNEQCSIRINIDLAECADCAYDYIEDAAYAETSRTSAMRNLLLAEETGVLNKGLASKYVMQIRAAEKIMNDLNFKYEPFEVPEMATKLLITD